MDVNRRMFVSAGLLAWYVAVSIWMAQAPTDPQFWLIASVLPGLFVVVLIATYRHLPLSPVSYGLITAFLTLHTIGVHYTYAEVPVGLWIDQVLQVALERQPEALKDDEPVVASVAAAPQAEEGVAIKH